MANAIIDHTITYRGFAFNRHRTAAGAQSTDRTTFEDTIRVQRFDFSPLAIRDQVEGLHLASGADFGPATRETRRVSLIGELVGSSEALLHDREASFMSAMSIEEAIRTSPSTDGASALDFYTPTAAPPTGLSSPVREMFLARPQGYPVSFDQRGRGLVKMVACEWLCADPNRYIYTPTAVTFSVAAGWSQPMPNWALGVGAIVYPTLVIDLNAITEAHPSLTISDGTTSLVIAASEEALPPLTMGGTITIDMATGVMTYDDPVLGDTNAAHWRTSAVTTFFGVPPGGSTWTITNTTGVDSIVATYRMARA